MHLTYTIRYLQYTHMLLNQHRFIHYNTPVLPLRSLALQSVSVKVPDDLWGFKNFSAERVEKF